MAFLVLSCIRTLTLLVHIRAWSWLLSAFLHGASFLRLCAHGRARARGRASFFSWALLLAFLFLPAKNRTSITNYPTLVRFGFHDPLVLDGRTPRYNGENVFLYTSCWTQQRQISDMYEKHEQNYRNFNPFCNLKLICKIMIHLFYTRLY